MAAAPTPVFFAKKSRAPLRISPPPQDEEANLPPATEFNFDENKSETSSTGTDSPNLVKSTLKAIQLKAAPEVMEGHAPGNKEVLDMIDDLFDNFFESQKSPESDTNAEKGDGAKKSSTHLKKNPSKGKVPKIRKDDLDDPEKDLNEEEDKKDDEDSKESPKKFTRSVSKGKVPKDRRDSKEESEKDQKVDSEKDQIQGSKSDVSQWWKESTDDKEEEPKKESSDIKESTYYYIKKKF